MGDLYLTDFGPIAGTGSPGPPGRPGDPGPPGPPGGNAISDLWVWIAPAQAAGTTVGATKVGVDHNSPSAATHLLIHKESANHNIDYSTPISAAKAGDFIYLQAKSNATSFHRYRVTGSPTLTGTTTWQIPVTTDSGSPTGTEPASGADVLVVFQPSAA